MEETLAEKIKKVPTIEELAQTLSEYIHIDIKDKPTETYWKISRYGDIIKVDGLCHFSSYGEAKRYLTKYLDTLVKNLLVKAHKKSDTKVHKDFIECLSNCTEEDVRIMRDYIIRQGGIRIEECEY